MPIRTQKQISLVSRWIRELRSGKYQQGKGRLCTTSGAYCCLGVLAEMQKIPKKPSNAGFVTYSFPTSDNHSVIPGDYFKELTGFTWDQGYLSSRNDGGMSFETIANALQKNNRKNASSTLVF